MTSKLPIRILRERVITTTRPGAAIDRKIALTYTVGPRPPQLIFIAEADLPDRVWRIDNPGKSEVPAKVLLEGDAKRRELVEADQARRGEPAARTI